MLPDFLTNPDPEVYYSENYITLDFETTNLDKGSALNPDNSIILSVWRYGSSNTQQSRSGDGQDILRHSYRTKWAGEFGLDELVEAVNHSDFIVAHNAKFELQWLERCGIDLGSILVWDTMLGDYVLGGNRYVGGQLSLEACAQRRYGEGKSSIVSKMIKAGIPTEDIPSTWLEDYGVRDVELTDRLFQDQLADMMEDGHLLPVMYNRCLLTPVLADIEKNGMQLDDDLVRTRLESVELEFGEQEKKLHNFTGGINLNSPKQMGEYLYDILKFKEKRINRGGNWHNDRTPKGGRKTDAGTIASLKCATTKQSTFVQEYAKYKELYNELSKYLRKFKDCLDMDGGRLKAQFNQSTTRTHRLSSTGLKYSTQFHNLPRAYKPLFRASMDGWLVGETDGATLEFGVAGHLGRDRTAIRDIRNGLDVHNVSAGIIGVSRQDAKAHTFKPLYGGTSGTPAQQRYYEHFKQTYDGITSTQQRWVDTVLDTGSLRTEWGLSYYWPDTTMERSGYVRNSTSICNYPVQAFATAEIIPIALVHFWHRAREAGLRTRIVNTIHDSIVVELPEEEKEEFHRLSQQCLIDDVYTFTKKLYDIDLTVPLGCGVSTGEFWGSKDETKYMATDEQVSRIEDY